MKFQHQLEVSQLVAPSAPPMQHQPLQGQQPQPTVMLQPPMMLQQQPLAVLQPPAAGSSAPVQQPQAAIQQPQLPQLHVNPLQFVQQLLQIQPVQPQAIGK